MRLTKPLKTKCIAVEWVDAIPENLDEGILYVSLVYGTMTHLCPCGCGSEVALKLSPKHWGFVWNGQQISTFPSIGNWQLPCRSHYWIREGAIVPSASWSEAEVRANRAATRNKKTPTDWHRLLPPTKQSETHSAFHQSQNEQVEPTKQESVTTSEQQPTSHSLFGRLKGKILLIFGTPRK